MGEERFAALRRLSDESRKRIFEFAMQRSDEILRGIMEPAAVVSKAEDSAGRVSTGDKLAEVLALLKNCRLYGLQSECYSFWDSVENTKAVDKFLKELEEEGSQ